MGPQQSLGPQQRLVQALKGVLRLEGDEQLERDTHSLLVGAFPDQNRKGRWYAVTRQVRVARIRGLGTSTILCEQHVKGGTTVLLCCDEAAAEDVAKAQEAGTHRTRQRHTDNLSIY